jgi:RHS repeat-associated protein
MEKDDEVKNVAGSSYDFGARMYDPRIGRWLAVDPLASRFPFSSPYVYALNNPIIYVDPDGEQVDYIVDKALEELGFRVGIKIVSNENNASSIVYKTQSFVHSGAESNKAVVTVVQHVFDIDSEGNVTRVEEKRVQFTVIQTDAQSKKGLVTVSEAKRTKSTIGLPDQTGKKAIFLTKASEAQKFADKDPLVKSFANLVKSKSGLVKGGELPFNEKTEGQSIESSFETAKSVLTTVIDAFGGRGGGGFLDKAFDFSGLENSVQIFIPEGKEKEAIKKFENISEQK